MISSEVQRTLVKSPPELWAELSDPAALSRHLGELGEIRITRVDPEQAVEWEAGDISGTVLIKPSGWGTKVTLTVNGELDLQEPPGELDLQEPPAAPLAPAADAHPPTEVEPRGAAENPSEPAFDASEPEPSMGPWPTSLPDEAEPTEEAWPDPIAGEPEAPPPAWSAEVGYQWEARSNTDEFEPELKLATRRSWLSRLFGRRRKTEVVDHEPAEALEVLEEQAEPPEAAASGEQPLEPLAAGVALGSPPEPQEPADSPELQEPQELPESPEPHEPPEHEAIEAPVSRAPQDSAELEPADMATALRAAEDATAEQVTAVLTAVLDRLGAAHHRPFSRG